MNNFEVEIQSDKQGVQGVPWSHSNACAGRKVNSKKQVVRKEARVLGQGGREAPSFASFSFKQFTRLSSVLHNVFSFLKYPYQESSPLGTAICTQGKVIYCQECPSNGTFSLSRRDAPLLFAKAAGAARDHPHHQKWQCCCASSSGSTWSSERGREDFGQTCEVR
jgi:hypothetical protein